MNEIGENSAKGSSLDERRKDLVTIGGLAVIYFVAGKLGLSMAFVHPSSTAVWPPTGIALAALLSSRLSRVAGHIPRRIPCESDHGGHRF